MAKNKISEWSATAANNTDIGGIDIAEGCAPSGINNAIRELMAQVKDQQTGTDADNFTVGGNLSVTGTTTLAALSLTGNVTIGDISSDTLTVNATPTFNVAIPVASGGTGVTTSTGSGSNVLSTSPTLVTPALGTPSALVLTNATGLPLSTGTTGTLPVLNGGTGASTSTGTGSVVLSGSPTLVTPALGTPSSGNLANCNSLPISTGVSGLAANVASFLATPSSANLALALTDETGTGSVVLSNSPTLVTPALGTPSVLVGTNITGTGASFTAGNATNAVNASYATTQVAGTNNTTIATTAFVTTATAGLGTMSTQNANNVAITGGTVAATFTGNVTGNVTGSSGSCTGNAATATSATTATLSTNSTNAIGYNQTWQDMTASRAAGTTYTNSTGKPIFISVRMSQDDGTLTLTVDGLLIGQTGFTAGPVYYTLTAIIPAGSTYLVGGTGGSLAWYELR